VKHAIRVTRWVREKIDQNAAQPIVCQKISNT
jgi:hypothetical protein